MFKMCAIHSFYKLPTQFTKFMQNDVCTLLAFSHSSHTWMLLLAIKRETDWNYSFF